MRDVRGEVAEQRKQLKELLDAGELSCICSLLLVLCICMLVCACPAQGAKQLKDVLDMGGLPCCTLQLRARFAPSAGLHSRAQKSALQTHRCCVLELLSAPFSGVRLQRRSSGGASARSGGRRKKRKRAPLRLPLLKAARARAARKQRARMERMARMERRSRAPRRWRSTARCEAPKPGSRARSCTYEACFGWHNRAAGAPVSPGHCSGQPAAPCSLLIELCMVWTRAGI